MGFNVKSEYNYFYVQFMHDEALNHDTKILQ